MTISAADTAIIRQWMAQAGVTHLRLTGPGVALELGPLPVARVVPVLAPGVGVLLLRHPMRADPLAQPGACVRAGDTVAMLQVGVLLLPVAAPADGVLGPARVAACTLVDYGTVLFDLHMPLEAPC